MYSTAREVRACSEEVRGKAIARRPVLGPQEECGSNND